MKKKNKETCIIVRKQSFKMPILSHRYTWDVPEPYLLRVYTLGVGTDLVRTGYGAAIARILFL